MRLNRILDIARFSSVCGTMIKASSIFVFIMSVFSLLGVTECAAATVSCKVKEVSGSILVLENCDTKRVKDFKKGNKVKVKLQKGKISAD